MVQPKAQPSIFLDSHHCRACYHKYYASYKAPSEEGTAVWEERRKGDQTELREEEDKRQVDVSQDVSSLS